MNAAVPEIPEHEHWAVIDTSEAIYYEALCLPALVRLFERDPRGAMEIAAEIEVAYISIELAPLQRIG